jgi:hypothetical protein
MVPDPGGCAQLPAFSGPLSGSRTAPPGSPTDSQPHPTIAGPEARSGTAPELTEINVTSPTGVSEIDAFAGTHLSDYVMAWVEQRCC